MKDLRLIQWMRTAIVAGGGQLIVQLVGFAAGILVVRWLTPEQYAYYTITNTTVGAMAVLTDGGVTSGVLAQGGPVWRDREALGSIVAAGMALRKRLALFACAVSTPLMLFLLRNQGASWTTVVLVVASVFPLYLPTVTGHLLDAIPRLHQQLVPLQRIQIGINLGRLALIAFFLPLLPIAAVATVAAGIPQWIGNWRLKRLADTVANWEVPEDPAITRRLIEQVRRMMPGAIYYSVSGQLTVWLISIFGNTTAVAAVGALGRIGTALSLLSAVVTIAVVPRFARIPKTEHDRIYARYWQANLVTIIICAAIAFALWLYPNPVLALLGPDYAHFRFELALAAASTSVGIIYGVAYSLGAARGVVAPPAAGILVSIAVQALGIMTLPMDTVAGVLWLSLLNFAAQWLVAALWFSYWGHRPDGRT